MFDCTSDVSHTEQMTQVIRYINISDQRIIEETFIDFIETKTKTGLGLAYEIQEKTSKSGLDSMDCRAQCYDNAAYMAGKYNGVQAHLLSVNEFAKFIPCNAHSLNLVGVNTASVSSRMVSFFGTVQN